MSREDDMILTQASDEAQKRDAVLRRGQELQKKFPGVPIQVLLSLVQFLFFFFLLPSQYIVLNFVYRCTTSRGSTKRTRSIMDTFGGLLVGCRKIL